MSRRGVQGWLATATSSLVMAAVATQAAPPKTHTIRVDLRLRTGGQLSGLVVDHTDHGLVVVHKDTPYVFSWGELDPGSAFGTKRNLMAFERGGDDLLTASDHYGLGLFALRQQRGDLAAGAFRQAIQLDSSYKTQVDVIFDPQRGPQPIEADKLQPLPPKSATSSSETGKSAGADLTEALPSRLSPSLSMQTRQRVLDAYKTFGRKVQEFIGADVVLLESDHFMIWTDWERKFQPRLVEWCESMYTVLCAQFDIAPDEQVFLAKCPVFCWRSKARFLKFARLFDGYSRDDAVGYTRSIEANGHTHVVLLRQGNSPADLDRFAGTLVHEGTHAFLHRLYSSRLIPHWINEGYADLMAERILSDRSPNGENAQLLAQQFVRYDWPITNLLESSGPISVHQYAVAHSVIAYLESQGADRLSEFVKQLKDGRSTENALSECYDGMTLQELEERWRRSIRAGDLESPAGADASIRASFHGARPHRSSAPTDGR